MNPKRALRLGGCGPKRQKHDSATKASPTTRISTKFGATGAERCDASDYSCPGRSKETNNNFQNMKGKEAHKPTWRVCIYMCIYIYICMYMYVHMYIYMYLFMYLLIWRLFLLLLLSRNRQREGTQEFLRDLEFWRAL